MSAPAILRHLIATGLLLFSFGVTYQLVSGIVWGGLDTRTYLVAAILLTGAWMLSITPKTKGHAAAAFLLMLFFPVFGLLVASALLALTLWFPPPNEGLGEIGEAEMKVFDIRRRFLDAGPLSTIAETFQPAISLLQSSDMNERLAAIDVLAELGGPEQIKHLQACLDDPEREVYQYAHSKISELHERHAQAIRGAESRSKEEALDSYLDYLHSGLLGEATSRFYRQKAITSIVDMLKERSTDVPLLSLLGELYLESGEALEAGVVLQRALEQDADFIEARWGLARLAYNEGDFENFLDHLAILRKLTLGKESPDDVITQTVAWWIDDLEDGLAKVKSR